MVGLLKGIAVYGSIILGLNAIGNIGVYKEKYESENTPVAIEEVVEVEEPKQEEVKEEPKQEIEVVPELIKPVFPNDSLTNQLIQVGDKVRVIDKGQIYNQYRDYLDARNISIDYWGNKPYVPKEIDSRNTRSIRGRQAQMKRPNEDALYTVSYINYHDTYKETILCIISCENGTYFIMNINALQLENGQNIKDVNNSNNDTVTDDEIVYWTSGKSYHKDSNCHNYVQAKYQFSGTMKECPKGDPCDDCCY